MGISLFKKLKTPEAPKAAPTQPPAPAASDGKERLTANDWAKKLQFNEVAAERAAMRAGKWHDLFTEEEFLALVQHADV